MARGKKGFAHFVMCNGKMVPVSVETYNNVVATMQLKKKVKPVGITVSGKN